MHNPIEKSADGKYRTKYAGGTIADIMKECSNFAAEHKFRFIVHVNDIDVTVNPTSSWEDLCDKYDMARALSRR